MKKKCCLCKKEYTGHGNTSQPLGKGKCCRVCSSYVVKARLAQARKGNNKILESIDGVVHYIYGKD